MSRDDLLADLQDEVAARPVAPHVPPPAAPRAQDGPPTPAVDLSLTPLRWRLPSVRAASRGLGVEVQAGPVRVSVALR
jgi:hypothetical protein